MGCAVDVVKSGNCAEQYKIYWLGKLQDNNGLQQQDEKQQNC
jgi:hypothetical protein